MTVDQARDYAGAVRQWRPAGEQGHAGAEQDFGFCYANGRGGTQDHGQAVGWYRWKSMASERCSN